MAAMCDSDGSLRRRIDEIELEIARLKNEAVLRARERNEMAWRLFEAKKEIEQLRGGR